MNNLHSTDLRRDNFDYPDDKHETIIRIVGMGTCFLLGAFFGALIFIGIMHWNGTECISKRLYGVCSEHGQAITRRQND